MSSNEHLDFINQMLSEADLMHQEPKPAPAAAEPSDDEVLEFGDNFDFDGFQVVRREFFAHINEPLILIISRSIASSYCISPSNSL